MTILNTFVPLPWDDKQRTNAESSEGSSNCLRYLPYAQLTSYVRTFVSSQYVEIGCNLIENTFVFRINVRPTSNLPVPRIPKNIKTFTFPALLRMSLQPIVLDIEK